MKEETYKELHVGDTLPQHTYYIHIGKRMVECVGVIDFTDLETIQTLSEKGFFLVHKGYLEVSSGTVWIYSDTDVGNNLTIPSFWFDLNDRVEHNEPSEEVLEQASWKNIGIYSIDHVLANIPDNPTPNAEMAKLIRSGSNLTLPVIKVKDDHLKKQVKAIIRTKRRSINNLPQLGGQSHLVANMKQALLNDTKMSTPYHIGWADILGTNFIHINFDNGKDTEFPLSEAVLYDSESDMIYYLPMEKLAEIKKIIQESAVEDPILRAKIKMHIDDSEEENTEEFEPEEEEEEEE